MPSKCSLFADQVLYLGHFISAAGVSPDPAKLRVLADWLTSKTVREMQSFFGFVNFYGDYISDATELTAPLYDLTAARKGDESIKLTAEHLESFEAIKQRLYAAPRLAHPDLEQPFVLYTDASKIAIGAVLLQRESSKWSRARHLVFLEEIVAGTTKLFYVRARMPRNHLCARAFPCISARPQVSSAYRLSCARLAVLEGAESLCSHFWLDRDADGVPDCNRVRSWIPE